MNRTSAERRSQILQLLCEGMSIRAVTRITGASKNTVASHEKWCSPINGRTFIVPRCKSRHTANGVLIQAGLKKAF